MNNDRSNHKISYIIVNWRTPKYVIDAAISIRAELSEEENANVEIIVVDNSSMDQSISIFHSSNLFSMVIENTSNLGFASACNIGLYKSKGEYVIFFNSDAEYIENSSKYVYHNIDKIVTDKLLVGPGVFNLDETWQHFNRGYFPSITRAFYTYILNNDNGIFDNKNVISTKEFEWISGVFIAVKHDFIKKLGGFPECYFMYSEDLLLCKNAKNLGAKIICNPNIRIKHHKGVSIKKANFRTKLQPIMNLIKVYNSEFSSNLVSSLIFAIIVFLGYLKNQIYKVKANR